MHSPPFTYWVMGSGMGKAIARLLAALPDTARVIITDLSRETARLTAGRINTALRSDHKKCVGTDFNTAADSVPDFLRLFPEISVMVSALPAKYSPALATAALKSGRHFLDLGGVVSVTKKMSLLSRQAQNAGVSVISDNGLMPGTGFFLERRLEDFLATVQGVMVRVGGLPQNPVPPVYYQRLFSLIGLRHLCFDPAPVLEDGKINLKPPFSNYGRVIIPELAEFFNGGEVEEFVSAATDVRPWKKRGIKNYCEITIRWPGFVDFVKDIPPEEFEKTIGPHINIPVNAAYPDLVWLEVRVRGTLESGTQVEGKYTLLDRFDPETGLSAMERTTGFSAAIVAHLAAQGKTKPGAWIPECALDRKGRDEFMSEIGKYFELRCSFLPLELGNP